VEWIAHRGANTEFAENTLAAFTRAFERGADAIELDVHATRDGEVVVHHDPVARAPRGGDATSPRALTIEESTLADLRMLWKAPPELQIPTLSAVLAIVPRDKRAYVEIKGLRIESAVADVLARSSVLTVVHSFEQRAIGRMRALAPDVPRGVLLSRRVPDIGGLMREAAARDVWPDAVIADGALVDAVHHAGGRVIVWTVNHPAEARRLIKLGVDGICTDDVRLRDSV